MKVFISWSGEGSISHEVAQFLRESLPVVLHSIEAYVSSEDIQKGEQWFQNISDELKNSEFGIICVTKDNLESAWLNFELGALQNKFGLSHVSPLLINFSSKELRGPLVQFQSTQTNKGDVYRLLNSLNQKLEKPLKEHHLKELFDTIFWPKFERKLKELGETHKNEVTESLPSERELLNEILKKIENNTFIIRALLDEISKIRTSTKISKSQEIESLTDLFVKQRAEIKELSAIQIKGLERLNNQIVDSFQIQSKMLYDFGQKKMRT